MVARFLSQKSLRVEGERHLRLDLLADSCEFLSEIVHVVARSHDRRHPFDLIVLQEVRIEILLA